jgi:hypothetical protein
MIATDYKLFLAKKSQFGHDGGFEPLWMPDCAFDFQQHLSEWAIRKGKAAIFAGCGLGKTLMELIFAANVLRKTNRPVLILTPLAVAPQTIREAEKFGIEASISRDGKHKGGIVVTNYERLHYFDSTEFIGAVGDESSAIKAFDGKRRKQVTRFFSKLPYRLLATATPSPNDYIELGTSSECLGVMTQSDMLGYFFRETENMRHTVFKEGDFWNRTKWTFKPHSETPFWRWVVSWARGCERPDDLGFDGSKFVLPPLTYHDHIVDVPFIPAGELFPRPAVSLHEQREERKRTVQERGEYTAELVRGDRPAIVWCHYNVEGDYLEKAIPDAVQVAGCMSLDEKEEKLTAFAMGQVRVLVTKPKIGCWGLNLQHCGHMTFYPSHSFEGFYQGVRRCWRFGRTEPVRVDIVSAPGESKVIAGLKHKQQKAEHMFASLVHHMNDAVALTSFDRHKSDIAIPDWLTPQTEEDLCPSSTSA